MSADSPLLAVLLAAGITSLAVMLRRIGRSWHPGDPLPHVPADAPLRIWHAATQREVSHGDRGNANLHAASTRPAR